MEEEDCHGEGEGGSHGPHGEEIVEAHLGGLGRGQGRGECLMCLCGGGRVAAVGADTLFPAVHAAHVLLAMGT